MSTKAYREANREKIAAYNRTYREANREKITTQRKVHRQGNKQSRAEWSKAYREANREKTRAYNKAYRMRPEVCERYEKRRDRPKEKERKRRGDLRRKYGLTTEAFASMLVKQGNACAICHEQFAGKKTPRIDHDHADNHVRGILCEHCNIALGYFRDSPTLLRSATAYLTGEHGTEEDYEKVKAELERLETELAHHQHDLFYAEAELERARPLLEAAGKVMIGKYQDVVGGSTVLIPFISEGEDEIIRAALAYKEQHES